MINDIIETFVEIDEVDSIFLLEDGLAHRRIFIFHDGEKYDDELMDRLLDKEWELITNGADIDVTYLPTMVKDAISPNLRPVYESTEE